MVGTHMNYLSDVQVTFESLFNSRNHRGGRLGVGGARPQGRTGAGLTHILPNTA